MFLICLIIIPFLFGLFCWQSERINIYFPRWIALISTVLVLIFSLLLSNFKKYSLIYLNFLPNYKKEYLFPWIPRFGINFHLALDSLSWLMIMMTSILGIFSVLCSWKEKKNYQGLFYLNLLWIIGSVIGIFLSVDMFLFFFFWEMMLIPMYFLISIWGNKNSSYKIRILSANKFFIYTQISSMMMLLSIISLVLIHYHTTNILTFNYQDLINTHMSKNVENLLMLLFFIALAIKMPIVPLHGWLPDVHCQAPTAGSVELAGILLKTSSYCILRFVLPFFPIASKEFSQIIVYIGLISVFYGAFMAISQNEIKRLLAYTSISHMGLILIALYSGNTLAYQGAIFQMISQGLSAAGMFIIFGQLYERIYTFDLRKMGGIWNKLNFIPALSLFFAFAMLGMPGTGNFIGEITILFGIFLKTPIISIISTFSLLFSSIYSLNIIHKAYYGLYSLKISLSKITFLEKITVFSIAILLILLGFFPRPIMDASFITISKIQNLYI